MPHIVGDPIAPSEAMVKESSKQCPIVSPTFIVEAPPAAGTVP